jgi:hypothetical protein
MKALNGSLVTLMAAAAFSQTPAGRPEFEVASVKPSASLTDGQFNLGVHIDGAMFRCTYFSMRNYLAMAYDVKDYQIVAPDWMATDHFDVVAKLPAGVTGEKQHRGMIIWNWRCCLRTGSLSSSTRSTTRQLCIPCSRF